MSSVALATKLYHEAPADWVASWSYGEPHSSINNGSKKVVSIHEHPGGYSFAPAVQLVKDGDTPLVLLSSGENGTIELLATAQPLREFLTALDESIRNVARDKCLSWFNRSFSAEEISAMHQPLLAPLSPRSDVLKVKTSDRTRYWSVQIQDDKTWVYCRSSKDALSPSSRCWLTVNAESLYFCPRMFGCTLLALDVLVFAKDPEPEFPFVTDKGLVAREATTKDHDGDATEDYPKNQSVD